jgi:hypothetical protein
MSTRTDKVITLSMTRKNKQDHFNKEAFIACHRSSLDQITWSFDKITWSPVFHYRRCSDGDDDDDDEYQEPCRCCLALMFRKEGRSNHSNIACRICFYWNGPIPYSNEC